MRAGAALASCVAFLGSASWASPRLDAARAHVSAAFAYFDEGRFADAVREIEAAYALDPVPELQYNLAQCHERLGHLSDAREAYRHYLTGAPNAPDRAEVEARVATLRSVPEAATPAPVAPVEKVVLKTIIIYREPPPPPGRAARIAGYGTFGLAVAAAVTGVVTGTIAWQNQNAVTNGGNPVNPVGYDGPVRASGELSQQLWTVCGVSAGLTALFTAAGIVLTRTADKVDSEAPRVTWGPALLPSGGGLVARGEF